MYVCQNHSFERTVKKQKPINLQHTQRHWLHWLHVCVDLVGYKAGRVLEYSINLAEDLVMVGRTHFKRWRPEEKWIGAPEYSYPYISYYTVEAVLIAASLIRSRLDTVRFKNVKVDACCDSGMYKSTFWLKKKRFFKRSASLSETLRTFIIFGWNHIHSLHRGHGTVHRVAINFGVFQIISSGWGIEVIR